MFARSLITSAEGQMPSRAGLDSCRGSTEFRIIYCHTTVTLLLQALGVSSPPPLKPFLLQFSFIFKTMLRAALRPVSLAARAAAKPSVTARALSTSAVRFSGHAQPPFFGEGAKAGEVPTDDIQATGLERLQVLGEKEGVDVFDYKPLDSSRIGTFENPVKVFSWVRTTS